METLILLPTVVARPARPPDDFCAAAPVKACRLATSKRVCAQCTLTPLRVFHAQLGAQGATNLLGPDHAPAVHASRKRAGKNNKTVGNKATWALYQNNGFDLVSRYLANKQALHIKAACKASVPCTHTDSK